MKKQVIALALFCCCLIGYAKDKRPFDYRFHKNDTINILKVEENDSTKKTTKYQIIVLEAKGSKTVLKFNAVSHDIDADSVTNSKIANFMPNPDQFMEKIKSMSLSPIIQYENGKPKSMVNFKEVKTSTSAMFDEFFNALSKRRENVPDSLKEQREKMDSIMPMIKRLIKPMIEEFMTEELIMSQYSDMVQHDLPQKLGKWSETKGGATAQCSLTATQNAGEYEYQEKAKTELSGDELKDPQLKDNPAIETFTEMGGLGKLMVAFLDSLSIESTTNGVIYSNGIPKHLVKEIRTSFSMMGQKKDSTKKVTISVIDK